MGGDEKFIHVGQVGAHAAVRVGDDGVDLFAGGGGVDGECRVAFEAMALPPQSNALDVIDAFNVVERVRNLIDEFGFNTVEKPPPDAANSTDGAG